MKVIEIEHDLTLNAPTEGYVRSPGLHMSELYNSLYEHIQPKRYAKGDGPHKEKMELGTAFEEALEEALAKRLLVGEHFDRPGEFVTQHASDCPFVDTVVEIGDAPCYCGAGVIFSPDALIYNGITKLGELKCSWYSIRHGIRDERFDKWWTQIKAYSFHLQTLNARLYAFFVNGDYSYRGHAGGACIKAYDATFTPDELAEEWFGLVRHGRRVGLLPKAA